MSSVTELPERQWVRWKATAIEWLAVVVACAASMLALVSMFVVAICVGIIWSQEARIDEIQSDVRIYSNRTIRLETWLKSKGITLEEIEND